MAKKYFDDQVVIWFGNFEKPASKKEECGFDVAPYDHKLVTSIGTAVMAAIGIKESIKYEGWDKYFVCPNDEVADKLMELVPIQAG